MGCFGSKESPSHPTAADPSTRVPPGPIEDPLKSDVFHHKSGISGIKVFPAVANWPAGSAPNGFHKVVVLTDAVFLARFDAVGKSAVAAKACEAESYRAFADALRSCNGDVAAAMRAMLLNLDRMVADKPECLGSGCTAVVVHMNVNSHRMVVGTVGPGHVVVGHATGSFRDASSEAMWIADGRDFRPAVMELSAWAKQQVWPAPAPPAPLGQGNNSQGAAARGAATSSKQGGAKRGGPVQVPMPTAASFVPTGPLQVLGFPHIKSHLHSALSTVGAADAASTSAPNSLCEVTSHVLRPQDQHVLLLSDGCLDQLSPSDAALFAAQFDTSQMQLLKDSACQKAPRRRGQSQSFGSFQDIEPLEVDDRPLHGDHFNVANLLVRHAAHKRSGVRTGHSAASAADVGVLSLSLDWPKSLTSHQFNMAKVVETRRMNNPVATYRWHMACQLAKFHQLRRRRLLRSWWDTTSAALRLGEQAARQKEVAAWKLLGEAVQVTRTGQVMRSEPGTAPPTTDASATQPAQKRGSTDGGVLLPAAGTSGPNGVASTSSAAATATSTVISDQPVHGHMLNVNTDGSAAAATQGLLRMGSGGSGEPLSAGSSQPATPVVSGSHGLPIRAGSGKLSAALRFNAEGTIAEEDVTLGMETSEGGSSNNGGVGQAAERAAASAAAVAAAAGNGAGVVGGVTSVPPSQGQQQAGGSGHVGVSGTRGGVLENGHHTEPHAVAGNGGALGVGQVPGGRAGTAAKKNTSSFSLRGNNGTATNGSKHVRG